MVERLHPAADGNLIPFCRLCEVACGLIADVEDGVTTSLIPDRDHPNSQGHVCVKGASFLQVVPIPVASFVGCAARAGTANSSRVNGARS